MNKDNWKELFGSALLIGWALFVLVLAVAAIGFVAGAVA